MLTRCIFQGHKAVVARPITFRALSSKAGATDAKSEAREVNATNNALVLIHSAKKNIPQSPWKMGFLVRLARGKWLPDALAQMKFSPKGKSEDVAKILQRGADIAKIFHSVIPEELIVKEIMVTKGLAQKRMRIMGRGRTGFGYKRSSHVSTKLEIIDFDAKIAAAKTASERKDWSKRKELVKVLKQTSQAAADVAATPVIAA